MKINKRQIQRIIRAETSINSGNKNFGSNFERQRMLKENSQLESMNRLADLHLPLIEKMMSEWEIEAFRDRPDPRADDIYELLFQLDERMMAIKENRE